MKKLNKLSYIAIGMVLALIIGTATPAFAATKDVVKQLTAYFTSGGKPITVYVNGTKVDKDANGKAVTPFTVDGTTYLPIRAIADALGKSIAWDGTTASVKIDDKITSTTQGKDARLNVTIDKDGKRHDSLDYTFALDTDAVGEWKVVDKCYQLRDFNPITNQIRDLGWAGISIYADGTMISHDSEGSDKPLVDRTGLHWTKGYFVDLMKDTIPGYSITIINGKTYMFAEWKTEDYITSGDMAYYVLEKISGTPSPAVKSTDKTTSSDTKIVITKDSKGVIHESMDYKFIPDKDTVGQWEQIDFVGTPDEFDSKDSTRRKYIEIGIHNFYDDGREIYYADKTRGTGETKWTKGYVWGGDDTIEAYEIKQLSGKTFMFIEFKNGDYTIRGQKPAYYVYVKTSDTPDPEFAK